MALVEMDLYELRSDDLSQEQVIVLREKNGERYLPIVIGSPEAKAIKLCVEGRTLPRPLTHDLLKNIIEALGATVERVVVTALEENTFYGRIHLRTGDETIIDIDARPSDSIALTLRSGSPIFVDDSVLEKVA